MYPRVSHLPSADQARKHAAAINKALQKTQALAFDGATMAVNADWDLAAGKVYKINSVQVVGPRITGWTAATGTPARGAFAAAAAGTASAAYVQAELQGALNRIAALEARLIAYDADLRTHGIIGT